MRCRARLSGVDGLLTAACYDFFATMLDRRKALYLVGETLRDVGVLVLVFGPLDAFFQADGARALFVAAAAGGGLLSVAGGIMLEAREGV